ncbi:hypothetical protein [Rhizobium sp. BK376]|nr:hypothetical protein [Rhizobium sp. BK376]
MPRQVDIIDIGYWFYAYDDPDKVERYEPPLWHQREARVAA